MPPVFTLACLALMTLATAAHAAADLVVSVGDGEKRFTAAELLARPDAATIVIPHDVSYRKAMTYRAVPLLALISDALDPAFDTLEVRAADGFVSQIPVALVRGAAGGGSVAWVAIEDPERAWPNLPGKEVTAGPFYVVWQHPERSNVGSEQWPYQTVAITGAESPQHRWPQIAVDPALPSDDPARRGQYTFVTQCMPCHKMKGGGAADVGPDLGQPMNPTQYLTEQGLRALIRDPKSVRSWPGRQMPAFDAAILPDKDLDAVIAYLAHMATR